MEIFPALDILDGKCVRLQEGKFDSKTIYSDDPASVVAKIAETGANHLHLVDLSGTKNPENRQLDLIRKIVSTSNLKIQTGGGVRTFKDVTDLLHLGIQRVVLGNIAVLNKNLTVALLKEYGPNRLTIAFDVQPQLDGSMKIATRGWQDVLNENVFDWIEFYLTEGLERILCTDIRKDGMMEGPNRQLYQTLVERFPQLQIQASGGVSQMSDLLELKKIGVHSAIVGKAFYEGKISIPEALQRC